MGWHYVKCQIKFVERIDNKTPLMRYQ